MNYTPEEIAELLKERPNQPHYIAGLVRRAVKAEREAEREACIQDVRSYGGIHIYDAGKIVEAIRARGSK
jgi:hypothetical protein